MAKFLLRLEARKLRKKGISVKEIARLLSVSKSSASNWVKDIILTVEQLEILRQPSIKGAELGRLRSALLQKERRFKYAEHLKQEGIEKLSRLSDRELLVTGLGLYWGEGSKKSRKVEFCNSDPRMIKFLTLWLRRCFNVDTKSLVCRVGINSIHAKRDTRVKNYWSKVIGIPLSQFRKTSYKYVINKKVYANFEDHYGTLTVRLAKPAPLYYKIMGLIEGLAWQGSSAS